MKNKKLIKSIILFILLSAFAYGTYYCWVSFPLINGYNAKNMCSCVFVSGRNEVDVKKEDLDFFPQSFGSIHVDIKDSSVTGTILGLGKRKAIYRKGLGCTLVNDFSEKEIKNQGIILSFPTTLNTDAVYWPLGDKLTDTLPQGINKSVLNKAIDFAFKETDSSKKIYTRAVIIVYNNQIVAEKYGNGFGRNSKLIGWSMGKSVTSALIGILVKEGKLNLAAPAPVAEWKNKNDSRGAITLENLLQQQSGLDFEEDYTKLSDVTSMLFNKGNMAQFTAQHSLKNSPGSLFYYSSGNTNILSRIIRTTIGDGEYYAFPYKQFFQKIGMNNTLLEPDASGTFVGSSYIYATARDYARFGSLYYNNGSCNGQQILPDGWVQKSRTSSISNGLKNYGYQFWLNGWDTKDKAEKVFPGVPDDLFYADGFGGQYIFIIPSKKLVVVRLGVAVRDEKTFLKMVCEAVN